MVLKDLKQAFSRETFLTFLEKNDKLYHIWKESETIEAKTILLPRTTKEISKICRMCYENNQPIIICGGLTGLVRATKSTKKDVVISLEKLNQIENVGMAIK